MIRISKAGKRKPLYGIGINDAEQVVTYCPYYRRWASMLTRCYGVDFKIYHSPYYGCSVCDEWLTFTTFKKWMKQQDWKGKCLDKDMLKHGNNVYGPDNCIFISQRLNSSIQNKPKGMYMRGVSLSGKKYRAIVSRDVIGHYDTEIDAYAACCKARLVLMLSMPEVITNTKLSEAVKGKVSAMIAEAAQ
tara:strand:- start:517 stop:1083 length:567 start_codon:yes stop_codon:yes gene_type:complete